MKLCTAIKNRYVQIVALALAITFIYSAIGHVIWQAILIPRSEEMDKVDLIQKKRAAYYKRIANEEKATDK